MITAISEKGIKRKIVINESIILAEKSDKICFEVKNDNDQFQIIFSFSDLGKEFSTSINDNEDPNTYDITLHKWNSSTSFIETIKSWDLIRNESSYWIHWRTFSNVKTAQRVFEITVWTSQNHLG